MNEIQIAIECENTEEMQKYYTIVEAIQNEKIEGLIENNSILQLLYFTLKSWIDNIYKTRSIETEKISDKLLVIRFKRRFQ